jgi:hypothetical protein
MRHSIITPIKKIIAEDKAPVFLAIITASGGAYKHPHISHPFSIFLPTPLVR